VESEWAEVSDYSSFKTLFKGISIYEKVMRFSVEKIGDGFIFIMLLF
jgi:hypothetical protein